MVSYNELKKGVKFIFNNQPHEVLEAHFLFKGRGHSVLQARIKNLITGNVVSRTFRPSENFEEAELSKIKAKFLYSHPIRNNISNGASRDRFFFCQEQNPANRFDLNSQQIGKASKFLKPNQIVEGIIFENKIINISLPIKLKLKVIEAPPGVKGDRAQGGTKTITLETGAKINVPLFIKEEDIIEVNTETNEYVRRVE